VVLPGRHFSGAAPQALKGEGHNPMRLLVDDRWAGKHGIGRFASEVLRRLPPFISMPPGLGPSNPLDPFWTSLQIARICPSVYFSPGYNPPLSSRAPFIFTIHDLIHLRVAEESSFAKRLYYEQIVRPALKKAFKVFTGSNFSKQEIADWSGIAAEKIVVVGHGVSAGFVPNGPIHIEDRPYLLYIGNRRPHKNLPRLLNAFRFATLARDVVLLCSGLPDPAISRWMQDAGLDQSAVRFTGNIPEALISDYYRGALAVLMPSLHEGFGLPALEAMACGTPVLVSNSTSLPEVVGDAGLLVDPLDVAAIADGIGRLVHDEDLRDRLKERGLNRVSSFNWDSTARKVLEPLAAAGLQA
jgi:glycosyltransferase involved in cell wall biosynthesis